MRSAEASKQETSDGICRLQAQQVRGITTVQHVDLRRPYGVDVIHRPIKADNAEGQPENLSHAQVEVEPDFENKSRFEKLKDALSRLAMQNGWAIEPRVD